VVGQRVVIRRLLRGQLGPTGGPAFTDVLGLCTAWDGGSMTLVPDSRHDDQTPLTIALADIVSGKPVPPRPSHLTRVSANAAERHTVGLWPGLETVELGEWVLRTDPAPVGRLIKRANSCLAIGSPGRPFDAAVAAITAFYAGRERTPMAQVETGSTVDADFLAAGWQPLGRGDNSFQAAPLARLHRVLRGRASQPAGPISLETEPDRVRAHVSVANGQRIATGAAVLEDDWLGVHGLAVDAEHRRRGLAIAVLAELVEWGAERGARTVWLQVETDNAPALALYEGLGFSEHHATRYLVPA
jgi:ribosomal protein S18 acetylase RimI-like enzyme